MTILTRIILITLITASKALPVVNHSKKEGENNQKNNYNLTTFHLYIKKKPSICTTQYYKQESK